MPRARREDCAACDVTDYFRDRFGDPRQSENDAGVLKAERRGNNVLILQKLNRWVQSIDGTRTKHKLTYQWLSGRRAELCEVQGEETIITSATEFDLSESLFDQYRLFP
jgi:hypothetical protein